MVWVDQPLEVTTTGTGRVLLTGTVTVSVTSVRFVTTAVADGFVVAAIVAVAVDDVGADWDG